MPLRRPRSSRLRSLPSSSSSYSSRTSRSRTPAPARLSMVALVLEEVGVLKSEGSGPAWIAWWSEVEADMACMTEKGFYCALLWLD